MFIGIFLFGVGTSLNKIFLEETAFLLTLEKELFAVSALSFEKYNLLFEKSFCILFPDLYLNSSLFGSVWIKFDDEIFVLKTLLQIGQVQVKY